MLAYSMISHMGYVFLGLLSGVVEHHTPAMDKAYGASLFYLLIYVFSTSLTFGLIVILSRKGVECEEIADLKGLNRRNPLLAGALLLRSEERRVGTEGGSKCKCRWSA